MSSVNPRRLREAIHFYSGFICKPLIIRNSGDPAARREGDYSVWRVTKGRLEAFSDGVMAVLITIMVLELKPPHGTDWSALEPLVPVFLTYVLSFVFIGIYWNNHHHLLHATQRING